MKRISCLIVPFVIFFSGHAIAGLFWGSNNYDECIIEKMKGAGSDAWQVIIEPAIRACERKFETKIENVKGIDLDWHETAAEGVMVRIGENLSDYKITKARLAFSKKTCEESDPEDYKDNIVFANFEGIVPGFGDELKALVKFDFPYKMKCFKTLEVYGKRVN